MAVKSSDQITIVDVTDGYSVDLSIPSITVNGGTSGLASSQVVNVDITARQGATAIAPSIGTCTSSTNKVTTGTPTTSGTTVTLPITLGSGLAESGTVIIPVTVATGVVIEKTFTFSVAIAGEGGQSQYTWIRYATSSSGAGMTSTPTSETTYIGYAITTTNSAPTSASSYTWSKYVGDPGAPGSDGADSIMITIISSAGTVFKNSSGSTTLTAHVYVGGVEATIANNGTVTYDSKTLGSIYWYKNGTKVSSPSKTLSVSATEVNNTMNVIAQLEA